MRQIVHVTVDNYQSLGHAELDLGRYTVICGAGDLGKSALLRAISAALFNETGTGFIRWGEKQCSVALTFDDEYVLTWTKQKTGSAKYELRLGDAVQEFTKLGAGVPDEIRDFLAIRPVKIDDTLTIYPQVHNQHDPPMLLTESASKAARALGELTKFKVILTAQQAAAKDNRKLKSDVNTYTQEVADFTERLAELPDLEKPAQRLKFARKYIAEATARIIAAEDISAAFARYDKAVALAADTSAAPEGLPDLLTRLQQAVLVARAFAVYANVNIVLDAAATNKQYAEIQLMNAKESLQIFMTELGVCPCCGQPWSEAHDV